MTDYTDPERFDELREAIAWRLLGEPGRPTSTERGFLDVPGGQGYVPVTGALHLPWPRWVIEGTPITVLHVQTAGSRLASQGLGSFARVTWGGPEFDGAAVAWGPTASWAIDHLVAELDALWPAVAAAGTDPVLAGSWPVGQPRRTGAGATVARPARAGRTRSRALWLRGAHLEITLALRGGADWIDLLRTALAVDPRATAVGFAYAYADGDRRGRFVWDAPGEHGARRGSVGPVT